MTERRTQFGKVESGAESDKNYEEDGKYNQITLHKIIKESIKRNKMFRKKHKLESKITCGNQRTSWFIGRKKRKLNTKSST